MNNVRTRLGTMDDRIDGLVNDCTACGACVRACPTPAVTGADVSDPEAVADGIRNILKGLDGGENARRWASECCGSGNCLSVCEEGINPRFMLTMARRKMLETRPEPERRSEGKQAFKSMSCGVRILSRLQLPPDLMERLSPSSHPEQQTSPDLIFYTGCNMLKTPHIGLLCLDVLDRLGARYEVFGGPSNCCGILQLRPGDTENAARQAGQTLKRFSDRNPAALASHENQWPFEIVNYMELIGESMGLVRTDLFKRLKLMQDVDAILAESKDMIETYGLDLEEVREVVLNDMLNDQYLPIDRKLHPSPIDSVAT